MTINSQYKYNYVELIPWGCNIPSTSPEIPPILRKVKIRYHIIRIPQILPDLSQISPIHAAQFLIL